jgi:hypothetical protein
MDQAVGLEDPVAHAGPTYRSEGWPVMEGPRTVEDARATQAELIRIRNRHTFYCAICLDASTCGVAKVYDNAIAACVALIEAAKVVDGDA